VTVRGRFPVGRAVDDIAALAGDPAATDALLTGVERGGSTAPGPAPAVLTLAAWNLERCKDVAAAAAILKATGAGIACLTEMDHGMARSGNRHTARDLAAALDMGYAFSVEFVELGHGHQTEQVDFAGQANGAALHGNAILSRWPVRDVHVLRLSGGEIWQGQDWHSDRIGSRQATFARLDTAAGPLILVVAHLESLPGADRRAAQMGEILDHLAVRYGDLATVIAGDMNPAELPAGAEDAGPRPDWFQVPERFEPLFAKLRDAGFDWAEANTAQHTRRALPNGFPRKPYKKLDWIFTRGCTAGRPRVVAAADPAGRPVSDHEAILADLTLGAGR